MGKAKIREIKEKKQMIFISYSSTNEQKFENCMNQIIREHSDNKKKLAQAEKVGEQMDKIYLGEYMRLSNDDGYENVESNSIGSQRSIINQYVSANLPNCVEIREYVDDGYTGLNFDRPDFQRMLQDIEKGFINTIIVKDLSRFGRDYIETGKFLFRDFKVQ